MTRSGSYRNSLILACVTDRLDMQVALDPRVERGQYVRYRSREQGMFWKSDGVHR